MDFAVSDDHRVKLLEIEKRDKYLDLEKKTGKLLNLNVTMMPIVIDVLNRVTTGLVPRLEDLEIEGRVETL